MAQALEKNKGIRRLNLSYNDCVLPLRRAQNRQLHLCFRRKRIIGIWTDPTPLRHDPPDSDAH